MASVNKVILVGNLGADPEVRFTTGGSAVTNFSVATTESYKDKNGNKVDKAEWHRIVTFGKLAEICGEYLAKGKQVYIEGKIQTRQWEDRDGNKKYTTEIIANQMTMLSSKSDKAVAPDNTGEQEGSSNNDINDIDDVPF